MTNMDKLYEAVEARGPVCVGLDTDFSYLPEDFVDSTLTKGELYAICRKSSPTVGRMVYQAAEEKLPLSGELATPSGVD